MVIGMVRGVSTKERRKWKVSECGWCGCGEGRNGCFGFDRGVRGDGGGGGSGG
jgi:hypothetical protein